MTNAPERERLMTVRLTPEEQRMVRDLAEADGLTVSGVVRMLVRRSYAERMGTRTNPGSRGKGNK